MTHIDYFLDTNSIKVWIDGDPYNPLEDKSEFWNILLLAAEIYDYSLQSSREYRTLNLPRHQDINFWIVRSKWICTKAVASTLCEGEDKSLLTGMIVAYETMLRKIVDLSFNLSYRDIYGE